MKRLIKLVLIALAAIIPAGNTTAQRVLNLDSNSISKESIGEDVTRTIKPVEDGYIVTYLFHKVLLDSDDYQQDCEIPIMTGFVTNNINGEPAYPYADDSFSVPSGQGASFQILEEEWVEFNSKPAPAKGPETMLAMDDSRVNNIVPIKSFSGWFPLETVCENSLRSYKGISIYSLGIKPVKYNLETGKAKICRKLQYKVSFSPINSLYNRSISRNGSSTSTEDNNFLSNITLNWREEHGNDMGSNKIVGGPNSGNMLQSPGYLIIAPSEFKSSADGFADWKRTLGNNVIVSCSNNWTNEAVRDSIVKIHNKTPLTYLLILGNHKKVPAHSFKMELQAPDGYSTFERDVLTDLHYALSTKEMNSDDDIIPELQYGRIPANSDTEVYNALEKIRYYESMTNGSEEFFNSNLFISEFQHHTIKGTEVKRNCQTTYELSQYMEDIGRKSNLAFYCRPDMDPIKWSQPTLYRLPNGQTVINYDRNIPANMLRPNFNWDADTEDVTTSINKGVSQVFYFAHGHWNQWDQPFLKIEDIRNLNNSDHNLPVVFSMACSTGSFLSNTCFSQEFLTKESGGAVAVFGFSSVTYPGYTDVAAGSFFNGMWPNPGFCPLIRWERAGNQIGADYDTPITSLGMLANYARYKMVTTFPESEYEENRVKNYGLFEVEGLTLFGDPSMHIFLNKPTKIKCSISCHDKKNVTISAPDNAIISVFNSKTKKVINYKGNTTSIVLPSDRCPYIICVHTPGTLPVIYNVGVSKGIARQNQNLLNEDWVWKYCQEYNEDYANPQYTCRDYVNDGYTYLNVGFKGTTVINGEEYKNCTIWRDGEEPADGKAPVIAYLREEGNKIYMRKVDTDDNLYNRLLRDYNISLKPFRCPSFGWSPVQESERLIYDFDLDKGEKLWFDNEHKNDKACLEVSDRYPLTIDGREIEIQQFGVEYYEITNVYCGLGAVDSLLPFPNTYNDYINMPHFLIQIADRNDNPIVTMLPGGRLPETGISVINPDNNIVDSSYYDMQGRQVSKPTEGIFIRVDRMQDGSVVSSKVCMQAR